jgi:RNA polymerase sigma-32 factor
MASTSSSSRDFVRAAMRAPYLERDEEHELALLWRDKKDQAALDRLTSAHMRLVVAIASRFRNFGLNMSDMIQEGHVGLLEAASRFEPERDVRFSTYASWWIRASIQDYILRNWSIVRGGTSSSQKALFFNLRRLRARLAQSGDKRPREEVLAEIAEALGVSVADVETMDSRLSAPDTSLNAPLFESEGDGSSNRQDFLVDAVPLPDESVGERIDGERRTSWLRSALTVLSERELRIVEARRLRDDGGATLESLGETLGISKERVRQIENRALEKLKDALLREHPDPGSLI